MSDFLGSRHVERVVDFLSEGNCIEFFLYSSMESFTDTVGLW